MTHYLAKFSQHSQWVMYHYSAIMDEETEAQKFLPKFQHLEKASPRIFNSDFLIPNSYFSIASSSLLWK